MSVTSRFVPAAGEWRLCQLMMVMVCAPQTVSAYNLVGVTFVRFLAVRKPLHVKEVRTYVRWRASYAKTTDQCVLNAKIAEIPQQKKFLQHHTNTLFEERLCLES